MSDKLKNYLKESGFKNYPKGWTKESVKSFAEKIGDPFEKGWFDKCVLKMEGEMGEGAKGFCASILDEVKGTTKWRGEHKEE